MTIADYVKFEVSDRLRMKLALKTCLACLAAEIVAYLLNFKNGYWIVFTTFLSTQLTMRMTISNGLTRIAGTAIGCIVGYLAVLLLQGHPYLIAVVLVIWTACAFYVGMSGIHPFGSLLAALTPFIVAYLGPLHLADATEHAVYRFIDIITGVGISWIVVFFIWPVKDEDELVSNLGRLVKKNLFISFSMLSGGRAVDYDKELVEFRRLVKKANRFDLNSPAEASPNIDRDQYRIAVALCRALFSHTMHLKEIIGKDAYNHIGTHFRDSGFFMELSSVIDEILGLKSRDVIGHLSVNGTRLKELSAMINNEIIQPHTWFEYDGRDREAYFSWVRMLFYVTKVLLEMSGMSQGEIRLSIPHEISGQPTLKESLSRLRKFDRDTAAGAFKGALSAFITLVLWVIPFQSVQAVVPSMLISYTGQKSPSLRRFFFLAVGSIIGGAVGLAFFFLYERLEHEVIAVGIMTSFVLFVFSYIGLSEEEWSFAGVMAGIIFIICIGPLAVMQGRLTAFYGSLSGMIFGGLMAAFIMKFIIPYDFRKLLGRTRLKLAEIYIRSFRIIEDVIDGKVASLNEMDKAWKDLRSATVEYIDLLRDLKWDLLFMDRDRNNPLLDEDTVYNIYRNFLSMFFVLKFIGLRHMNINIETSLRKAMSLLMRLHEEWNSLVTGGKSGDISSIGEESIELWRDCENTLRLEIAAKGYASDGKNLLYDEIFLFDLCAQIRKIADVLRLFMDNPELANSVREGE